MCVTYLTGLCRENKNYELIKRIEKSVSISGVTSDREDLISLSRDW